MTWWPNIISTLSIVIAVLSLCVVFIYRKKDFQITILKQQILGYSDLLSNLAETSKELSEAINKKLASLIDKKGMQYSDDELTAQQYQAFVEFGDKYNTSYNQFQKNIFLFPEDVIDAAMEYYQYIPYLFEKENDHDLGLKLTYELNQKYFDVVNVIRQHMGIDDISASNMKILSSGKHQLKFTKPLY